MQELEDAVDLRGGFVHRRDLLDSGWTDNAIASAKASGALVRLRVGTYTTPERVTGRTPEQLHLLQASAVVSKFTPGSVALSHHSAAIAHGISVWGADLDVVHLTRLDDGSGRSEAGVHHHRHTPDLDVTTTSSGHLALAPTLAVWQVACATGQRGALVVMDSALHRRLVMPDELAETAGRLRGHAGSRMARFVLPRADAGAQTVAESLLRHVCDEFQLPRPETQFEVTDPDGRTVAWTDLGWRAHRHVAEVDGRRKYVRDLLPGADAGTVVFDEKVREDKIRAQLYGVTRTVYPDVVPSGARRTGERLSHDLHQSHRLYARGRRFIV